MNHTENFDEAKEVAESDRIRQTNDGFKYLNACIKSLENYYFNNDKYNNFEEFYPEILMNFQSKLDNVEEKEI